MGSRGGSVGQTAIVVVLVLAAAVGGLWMSGNLGAVDRLLGFTTGDAGAWSCFWDPTINDDWHDDVLCARGLETVRPILLPNQSFVTEAKMMAAAAEYEATLNG